MRLEQTLLKLLHTVEPERARNIALGALRLGLAGHDRSTDDPALAVVALGLKFRNPIGLAAGIDKDAKVVRPLMRLGFGFVEIGSITPRPQAGNPRPRLFRLPADRALINRMGMNSEGVEQVARRLAALGPLPAVLGVSVGINKEGALPERDYPALIARVAPYADYVAINVSSPNTPGLRDLHAEARLRAILSAVAEEVPKRPPLLVKIAPDLADDALAAVVECAVAGGAAGLIVANTTTARPANLRSARRNEVGGLSGAPLFELSTRMLARAYRCAAGRLTLIGCGGVSNGAEALVKIRAGASLVQVCTAFAYEGPALIPRMKAELAAALRAEGFPSVAAAVGIDAAKWCCAEGFSRAA